MCEGCWRNIIFTKNEPPVMDIYKRAFLDHLNKDSIVSEPKNLYLPVQYIMRSGGKRLRPLLVLMACDIFGGDFKRALDASLCVEMFHNFTLIHDDIMDSAEQRRGRLTVHKKWDINTGILSGDALMILAWQKLENYDNRVYKALMNLFNKTALEVCEGQQLDIDFESQETVLMPQYFKMISYKTAVLVACALKMGAIIAGAAERDQEAIYNFGIHLGVAFQLQDDYLDCFGSEGFGKKIGGDIIENKKTFLYIKSFEMADQEDRNKMKKYYSSNMDPELKIKCVKEIFTRLKVDQKVVSEIQEYTRKANDFVDQLSVDKIHKDTLKAFGMGLMNREI